MPARIKPFLVWCFGASLFAHCIGFIGIVYFDQMQVIWYWLLGIFGTFYGLFLLAAQSDEAPRWDWLRVAFYAGLVLLLARLTAHDARLFF